MNELPFNFKDIVEHSQDPIFITNAFPLEEPGAEIVFANDAYARKTGLPGNELIGKQGISLQAPEVDDESTAKIREAFESQQTTQVIYKKYDNMGDEYWIELTLLPLKNAQDEVTHYAAIERDISVHKQLESMLEELPRIDALTGLLNRRVFDEVMAREFSLYQRAQNPYSILIVDIDHFKRINDIHSQELIIKSMASSFELIFRSYDQVARIGEDQFCILLRQTTLEQALISAIRYRQKVQTSKFAITHGSINITVSIGVSQVSSNDITHADAFDRAYKAMQQAKNNGRDQVQMHKEGVTTWE